MSWSSLIFVFLLFHCFFFAFWLFVFCFLFLFLFLFVCFCSCFCFVFVVVCFCLFMSGSCLSPFVRIVVAWWILVASLSLCFFYCFFIMSFLCTKIRPDFHTRGLFHASKLNQWPAVLAISKLGPNLIPGVFGKSCCVSFCSFFTLYVYCLTSIIWSSDTSDISTYMTCSHVWHADISNSISLSICFKFCA